MAAFFDLAVHSVVGIITGDKCNGNNIVGVPRGIYVEKILITIAVAIPVNNISPCRIYLSSNMLMIIISTYPALIFALILFSTSITVMCTSSGTFILSVRSPLTDTYIVLMFSSVTTEVISIDTIAGNSRRWSIADASSSTLRDKTMGKSH